jgi:hypothetical protein
LLLLAHHRFGSWWDALPALVRRIWFFVLIIVGWVFFRATDVHMAFGLLTAMFCPTPGLLGENVQVFLFVLLFSAWWAMFGPNAQSALAEYRWRPSHGLACAVVFGLTLAIMAGGNNSPFLYFQF